MTQPLFPPACCYQGCDKQAVVRVETASSERLRENWWCCMDHMTRCMSWLVGRDKQWGFSGQTVRIIELPPAKA